MSWIDFEKATNGIILSDKFKTARSYVSQPVTLTDIVQLYVTFLRPNEDCPFLFQTGKGTGLGQGYVNKGINQYFRIFGLNISITNIRKMIDAVFFEALQARYKSFVFIMYCALLTVHCTCVYVCK